MRMPGRCASPVAPPANGEDESGEHNNLAAESAGVKRQQPRHLGKGGLPGGCRETPPTRAQQTQSADEEHEEKYFHPL